MKKYFLQENKIFKRILKKFLDSEEKGTEAEALLELYPEHHETLSELVNLKKGLKNFRNIHPGKDFKSEALKYIYAEAAAHENQDYLQDERPVLSAAKFRPSFARPLIVFVSVFLFIIFSFASTIYASADTVPGDVLYAVKRSSENIRLTLTPEKNKGKLYGLYLGRRLDEAEILLSADDDLLLENAGILLDDIDSTFTICIERNCLNQADKDDALSRIDTVKNKYRQRCGQDNGYGLNEGGQKKQGDTEAGCKEQQAGPDDSSASQDNGNEQPGNGYKNNDAGNSSSDTETGNSYKNGGQGKKQQ